jgi:beta-N-acetylhexosaminidase
MSKITNWAKLHRFWIGVVGLGLILVALSLTLVNLEIAPAGQPNPNPTTAGILKPTLTPTSPTPSPTIDPLTEHIQQMTSKDKAAAVLMLHTPGTNALALSSYVKQYHLGGLILMGDNIPSTSDQLKALTADIQAHTTDFPLLIATDQEGCSVKRLPWDNFDCPSQLKNLPVADSQTAFSQRGQLLKQAGINIDFGVVADVTDDPQSFIYPRVFGGTPGQASPRVAAAVKGLLASTAATIKHFPGHGETEANSHSTIPSVDISKAAWQSRDKPSFVSGIQSGAQLVMFGHLRYTQVARSPASLSPAWHQILRDELGFTGVAVTDDMVMLQQSGEAQYQDPLTNAIAALTAGNDLVLFVNNHSDNNGSLSIIDVGRLVDGLAAAIDNGQISADRINQAVYRTLSLRQSVK